MLAYGEECHRGNMNENAPEKIGSNLEKIAEQFAQMLVLAIDERYAKRRKKAKSYDSPPKLSTDVK